MTKNLRQKSKNKLLNLTKVYIPGIFLLFSMIGCDRCKTASNTPLLDKLELSVPKKNIVGDEKVELIIKNLDSKVADLSLYELQLEIIEQKGKDNANASGAYLVYEPIAGNTEQVANKAKLLLSQLKGKENLDPNDSKIIHIGVLNGEKVAHAIKFTIALCSKDAKEVSAAKHTIVWTEDKKQPEPLGKDKSPSVPNPTPVDSAGQSGLASSSEGKKATDELFNRLDENENELNQDTE